MPYRVTTLKFLERLDSTQIEISKTLTNMSVDIQKIRDEYEAVSRKIDELSDRVNIQNGRIGRLEKREYFAMGALAILSGIATYVFFHVFKVL